MNCTVGLIGFGRFGRLMARYLAADFHVQVWDPTADGQAVVSTGAWPTDFMTAAQSDVVIPAVPISRLKEVLNQIKPHLKSEALVIDVCSVKEQPIRWMQNSSQ